MITKKDVEYIAALARIRIGEDEAENLTRDLENILGHIDQLSKLDMTNVEPTSHVLPLRNVFREDEIRPSLSQDAALSVAIAKKEGAFKVPPVIE